MMTNKQERFEALVRAYHADLYRYAYWLSQQKSVAEDLVQDTFLRAWKGLDQLLDTRQAKSWLITILRRENARRFERKQFDYQDTAEDILFDDDQLTAEQLAEQRTIRRHIMQLPLEYREPLLLQLILGMTGEEIAVVLSMNLNTANTRLFRARQQLKERLDNPAHGGHRYG